MKATVISTRLAEFGTGTAHVNVRAELHGDSEQMIFVPITITDGRAGWARRELSVLGFDCDTRSIVELDEDPQTGVESKVLAGVQFEVDASEDTYNNKTTTKYQIVTQTRVSSEKINHLDAILRGAKKSGTAAPAPRPTMQAPVAPRVPKPLTPAAPAPPPQQSSII